MLVAGDVQVQHHKLLEELQDTGACLMLASPSGSESPKFQWLLGLDCSRNCIKLQFFVHINPAQFRSSCKRKAGEVDGWWLLSPVRHSPHKTHRSQQMLNFCSCLL